MTVTQRGEVARHMEPALRATGRAPGVVTVLGVELSKLAAQKRSRFTLLGCVLAPFVVTVVLNGQQRPPKDTLYGRHIHDSGFAVALFVLTFATQWVLPFLTALVAGDIFASEDHHGTWKTTLTRSVSRTTTFVAKCVAALAFATAALATLAASTIVAGVLLVGRQPLIGLTGQTVSASSAATLVGAAWATALPPMFAFTAIAIIVSVASRNPAIGVVGPLVLGLVSQLVGWLGGIDSLRRLLPTTPFDAWHGLLTEQRYYGLITQGALVSLAWVVVCLGVALVLVRRRDFTGA